MNPDQSAARKIEIGSRRYRIRDAAVATPDDATGGPAGGGYAKNRVTGALFRLGAEEYFLLDGLASGLGVDALVEAFAHQMHLRVPASVIEQFAEDMVNRGILEPVAADEIERPTIMDAADHSADAGDDNDAADDDPDTLDFDDGDGEDTDFDDDADETDDEFTKIALGGADRGGEPGPAPAGPANPRVAGRSPRFADAAPAPVRDMAIVLFDPTFLLRVLNFAFGWLARILAWLTMPLTVVALLSIFHRLDEVMTTLQRANGGVNLIGLVALSMVTVNLATRLVIGAVIRREGAEVRRFGITFLLFVIPRFAIDMTNLHRLDRSGRMRVFAGALRTRLLIFALCTLLWDVARLGGTGLADLFAILGQISLLSFLISAFPLLSGEGYRLMAAYFNQPMLRERALAVVFGGGAKRGLPPPKGREWWIFFLYGLGTLIFSAFVLTLVAAYSSTALIGRFGGTGAVLFLSLICLMVVWFLLAKGQSERLRAQIAREVMAERRAERGTNPGTGAEARTAPRSAPGTLATAPADIRNLPVPAARHSLALREGGALTRPAARAVAPARPLPGLYAGNAGTRRGTWIRRAVFLCLAAGAVYVAMLPYQYDAGGDFTILPEERVEVVARVPGELAEVLVEEGDVVSVGDILAQQLGTEERHALAVSQASLDKARAQLETLLAGATEEELRVAEEEVARAAVVLPFLKAEADRARQLREHGSMSASQADRVINQYDTARAELRSAEANLQRVGAEAQSSEIAAARADIDRFSAEVGYYQRLLADTELLAPVPGRVVMDAEAPVQGTYLEQGELLMEIENHRVARAEIRLPETDIGLVAVGQPVTLKAWARPDEERQGTVTAIAPVAEPEEFGQIVRVRTQLPNDNGFFRPGMTGFAKIKGPEMRVWEAYSRMFIRFALVEVWGWIP